MVNPIAFYHKMSREERVVVLGGTSVALVPATLTWWDTTMPLDRSNPRDIADAFGIQPNLALEWFVFLVFFAVTLGLLFLLRLAFVDARNWVRRVDARRDPRVLQKSEHPRSRHPESYSDHYYSKYDED